MPPEIYQVLTGLFEGLSRYCQIPNIYA